MIFETIIVAFQPLIIIENWKFSKTKQKIFEKKPKKKFFFEKKLICEKSPSLRQKMMIYHKMYMSWVYENVF